MNTTTIQDAAEAEMFLSPLYEKLFQRENLTYNVIYPVQNKQIIDNYTTAPEMLTYNIPNQNYINVADSYLSMKIKIVIGATAAGDTIIQRFGKLYHRLASDGSETVIKTLPLSARGFLDRIQVTKQNQAGNSLDFQQKDKYRDVHNYSLLSQDYVNQFSDYLFYNSDDKVIFTAPLSADTNQAIWMNCIVPFAEISPIFSVYPLFPAVMLNTFLQLDIFMNTPVLADIGVQFADFSLKVCFVQNNKLNSVLKAAGKDIYGTFNNYKITRNLISTRGTEQVYQISQEYKSLDGICVQAYDANNLLCKKGYSNIDGNLATNTTITFSNIQFETNNMNLFTKQINTLQDLYRLTTMDNNQSTNYYSGCPQIFTLNRFL